MYILVFDCIVLQVLHCGVLQVIHSSVLQVFHFSILQVVHCSVLQVITCSVLQVLPALCQPWWLCLQLGSRQDVEENKVRNKPWIGQKNNQTWIGSMLDHLVFCWTTLNNIWLCWCITDLLKSEVGKSQDCKRVPRNCAKFWHLSGKLVKQKIFLGCWHK